MHGSWVHLFQSNYELIQYKEYLSQKILQQNDIKYSRKVYFEYSKIDLKVMIISKFYFLAVISNVDFF